MSNSEAKRMTCIIQHVFSRVQDNFYACRKKLASDFVLMPNIKKCHIQGEKKLGWERVNFHRDTGVSRIGGRSCLTGQQGEGRGA